MQRDINPTSKVTAIAIVALSAAQASGQTPAAPEQEAPLEAPAPPPPMPPLPDVAPPVGAASAESAVAPPASPSPPPPFRAPDGYRGAPPPTSPTPPPSSGGDDPGRGWGTAGQTGWRTVTEPNLSLVLAGAVTFGTSYLAGVAAAAGAAFDNESAYLTLPLAGPWATLAERDYGTPLSLGAGDYAAAIGLLLGGLAQLTGSALFVAGFVAEDESRVADVAIAPIAVDGGQGAGLSGRF